MTLPAVILAGGRSRRMGGGDKCLLPLAGTSILARIITILSPQTGPIAINSNSDPARFSGTGLQVIADVIPGRLGPLAGIITAMRWAKNLGADQVLTVACDTPFLPNDLVARLEKQAKGGAAVAASGGMLHGTTGLWPLRQAEQLEREVSGGVRCVSDWLGFVQHGVAEFPNEPADPFWNINSPADWRQVQPVGEGSDGVDA